jgi:hypothetical protein
MDPWNVIKMYDVCMYVCVNNILHNGTPRYTDSRVLNSLLIYPEISLVL